MTPATIKLVSVIGEPSPERPALVTFRYKPGRRRKPFIMVRVHANVEQDAEVIGRAANRVVTIGDRHVSLRAVVTYLTEFTWPWKVGTVTELTPEWLAQAEYRLGGPLGPIQ